MTLDEFLAIEVMGWKKQNTTSPVWWLDAKTRAGMHLIKDWSPTTNIEQAMMCLERFQGWTIGEVDIGNSRGFMVVMAEKGWRGCQHESLPMAISLACARAKGWGDE